MPTPTQPLNLSDFTGGLNLRADAFQLKGNESPAMLNVDVDPRGGVRSRKGWTRWNGTAVAAPWHPQRLHVWEMPSGTREVLVVNNVSIKHGTAGTFSTLNDDSGVLDPRAPIHGADFADWGGKLYIVAGGAEPSRAWTGSGNATVMSNSGTGNWQDDYTAPNFGNFPKCDFVTTYQGYMVVASTNEDSVAFPNRVRFSHPNSPENWKQLDYIDINGGGAKITGIVAFSDHIVVFKTASVWAIYGNDMDTFTPVNITRSVGAIHRNAICVAEDGAYFYSHPTGVLKYTPGASEVIKEVSQPLRPMIDSVDFNEAQLSNLFLGFLNRRLWFSVPYEVGVVATDARATFVYDPSIEAWTLYRDADGDGLGPFATGAVQGDGALLLAAHRIHGYVLKIDDTDAPADTIDTTSAGFATLYATPWLHAGWPSLKKSWRRPDYVVTEEDAEYTLHVDVMRDYDEGVPRSAHNVLVETGTTGFVWGSFTWGDGSTWGGTPSGAHIEKGGSIGLAKSVQLKFSGTVGLAWGVNAVVMKFRPRRFK